ncbi:MAG: tetratricopeptide repeat protein [Fibromonadaceae bacterium]|jgi:tetratricopeptide (TPR) repeat protein|nr:tetratricopeptide repeat protein [Fibromonadaceae bacterium]
MDEKLEEALASLKCRLDNYDYKAFADYVAAVDFTQIKPDFLDPPNNVYMSREERKEQIAEWTAKIEKEPNDSFLLLQRGCAYHLFGWEKDHSPDDFDKAIADFNAALKIKPDYPYYLEHRAMVYYYKKEYDKAIADYTTILNTKQGEHEVNPNTFAECLFDRGRAYHCKDDYDNAIADYTAAPIQDEDLIWRGLAYACKKEYDKAIADLQKASQIDYYYTEMAKALLQKVREQAKL